MKSIKEIKIEQQFKEALLKCCMFMTQRDSVNVEMDLGQVIIMLSLKQANKNKIKNG